MKKICFYLMLISLFFVVSLPVGAEEYPGKKVFIGKGTFQRYVNFRFEVPAGNCGNLQVYKLVEPSFPSTEPAHWEIQFPGEIAERGFYRFVNNESVCTTKFSINGELHEIHNMETWMMTEIEPATIGLLAEKQWFPRNIFWLSEDDNLYDYQLLMPNAFMNTFLSVVATEEFISAHGNLVGVIISDSRGFLKQKISWKWQLDAFLKTHVIREDDIIVLIFKH